MKKSILLSIVSALFIVSNVSGQSDKLISTKTQVKFFSSTPAEDIEAINTTTIGTLNKKTGSFVFSVPMQGFEFKKSMMQKHFNNAKFLDTKTYPKAKLIGTIAKPETVNFSKDGSYSVIVEGELTIKGVTKPVKEMGTIIVNGSLVKVESKFNITLADYGISFVDGKPSSNIAKAVEVKLNAEYKSE